jgi:hypothetical protein
MRIARALSLLREERERIVREIQHLEHSAEYPKLKSIRPVGEKRPQTVPKKE